MLQNNCELMEKCHLSRIALRNLLNNLKSAEVNSAPNKNKVFNAISDLINPLNMKNQICCSVQLELHVVEATEKMQSLRCPRKRLKTRNEEHLQ